MASEIHVGNIGTRFSLTIEESGSGVDVSSASSISVIFRKPDDEVIVRTGSLLSDGTDGKIYYDTIAGDLDEAGHYKVQAKIALPAGTFYTDIHDFKTHCNL